MKKNYQFLNDINFPSDLRKVSENNLQNSKVDLAISDLEKLLKKHPNDSLASKAQYKLSSIYLNWKNDPDMGFKQLEATLKNYDNSVHGKQALDQINEFPQYLINKAESLRKQKLLKESVDHLMFMINKYEKHQLASKAQYMLGDVYMNDFRDFTTAIQEYRKVIDKYTESEQEPHAQFMIGYIYANVINDEKIASEKKPKKTITIIEDNVETEVPDDEKMLKKLNELVEDYKSGKITEEEFISKKAELLN